MTMIVDIRETATRRYFALEWRNGCLPIVADINDADDLRRAQRLAEDLGEELMVTARAWAELFP